MEIITNNSPALDRAKPRVDQALHVLDVYNNNGRLENGDLMLSCFVTAPKGRKVQEGFTKLLEKYRR